MAKKIVLDSSVIIKWLNKNSEANIAEADQVLKDAYSGKVELFAPDLVKYETGKLLVGGKKLTQSESKIPIALLYDLPIEFVSQSQTLTKESFAIASAFQLSYNESVFLALSEQKSAVYLTEIISTSPKPPGIVVVALKDY